MSHVRQAFDDLWSNSELTDVTLYADGKKIPAHRMLLSACSAYFRDLFRAFPQEHPIVVLKGVNYVVLTDILKFIYNGEVSVDSAVFERFLQTAEYLQISGLTENLIKGAQNAEAEAEKNEVKQKVRRRKRKCSSSIPEDGLLKVIKQEEDNDIVNRDECSEEQDLVGSIPPDIKIESEDNEEKAMEEELLLPLEEKSTENNSLKCPICSKVFSHPYSLHHHKPVHMGRTQCPICHAVLSRRYNLKMHMKTRHNVM
ncbi:unnamed protein product [Acanthoscelides obtectus]|nr:unnamed protein product [Acanthoscelides obtectus]CAK1629313.1 Broad-complex core protein isoform 6 [Acanthoscelides obtectus]